MDPKSEDLEKLSLGELFSKMIGIVISTPGVLDEKGSPPYSKNRPVYEGLMEELNRRERAYLEYRKSREFCRMGASRSDS